MSLVIVVVLLIYYGIRLLAEALQPKSTFIPTPEENDKILREITGKSQAEAKRIIHSYYYNKNK